MAQDIDDDQPPASTVLTKDQQAVLTPGAVVADLADGNQRFRAGELTSRDHQNQLAQAAHGQYPKAVVLSCIDSRVPVETIFDCGIGDLFVARVAGNIVNPDVLGSLEFACKVAGAKLVMVLGHQYCGAVASAIDGAELGNVTELLSKITPALQATQTNGDRTRANASFVADVTVANVHEAIARIRSESPILAEMETSGDIAIVGAIFSLTTGEVALIDS